MIIIIKLLIIFNFRFEFDGSEIEKKNEQIAQSDVVIGVDPIDLDGIYLESPDDLIEETFYQWQLVNE